MTTPGLTLFYIVEPPDYQMMACLLLASIRRHFPAGTRAIGYCPAHRMADLHPAVRRAHDMLGADIRPMDVQAMWDSPYPHGNKIIASLQPRETEFSAFVDSDVLFLADNRAENLARPGHVSCSAAASMVWTGQEIWDRIYAHFGMDIPQERIRLMRRRHRVVPYFSAGLVVFPEQPGPGGRFPELWHDTARRIDRLAGLPGRRPYLDQLSLPLAIRRAGFDWNILPEEQHYILGGRLRGQPLPEDRPIFTIHYRNHKVLKEIGFGQRVRKLLKSAYGVRRVERLAKAETAPALVPALVPGMARA